MADSETPQTQDDQLSESPLIGDPENAENRFVIHKLMSLPFDNLSLQV